MHRRGLTKAPKKICVCLENRFEQRSVVDYAVYFKPGAVSHPRLVCPLSHYWEWITHSDYKCSRHKDEKHHIVDVRRRMIFADTSIACDDKPDKLVKEGNALPYLHADWFSGPAVCHT